MLNPKGTQKKCCMVFNNKRTLSYACVYMPTVVGHYTVVTKFAAKEIPKSPFLVRVTGKAGNPLKVFAQEPGTEKTGVIIRRKTYLEVITKEVGPLIDASGLLKPVACSPAIKAVPGSTAPSAPELVRKHRELAKKQQGGVV